MQKEKQELKATSIEAKDTRLWMQDIDFVKYHPEISRLLYGPSPTK